MRVRELRAGSMAAHMILEQACCDVNAKRRRVDYGVALWRDAWPAIQVWTVEALIGDKVLRVHPARVTWVRGFRRARKPNFSLERHGLLGRPKDANSAQ